MNRCSSWKLVLLASCLFPAHAWAEPGIQETLRAEVDRKFSEARTAYDDERLDDAVRLQQEILELGFDAPALQFNLANALFKQGKLGPAVLHYRRAQYQAPRDPDIPANLRFAMETAGAKAPPETVVRRLTSRLTQSEWAVVAFGTYWGVFACLAIAVWWRRTRRPALRVAAALAAVGVLAIIGLAHWYGLRRVPEMVVTRGDQQVLFAPLRGSTVHILAPEGTILRVEDTVDGWLKIAKGKQEGWIPSEACDPVDPKD